MASRHADTQVGDRLRSRIQAEGPLPVDTVMAEVGAAVYADGPAIGADGHFVTAPEISQIFGEVIGLWLAVVWQMMGAPSTATLVECGPGRGTLMADALRALRAVPAARTALALHLVETSPALRARQRTTLGEAVTAWHDGLETVPDNAPLLLVANEFLDALPTCQYVRRGALWRRRCIGLDPGGTGRFVFVDGDPVSAEDLDPAVRDHAPDGSVAEVSPAARTVVAEMARRVTAGGGAALLIDYGHGLSAPGDTLQAVRAHRTVPVLENLGEADLTTHVDFQALAAQARSHGAVPLGPIHQGAWLRALGAEVRAAELRRGASPRHSKEIRAGLTRLIDPGEMGTLFRVFCVAAPGLPVLPGFEDAGPGEGT